MAQTAKTFSSFPFLQYSNAPIKVWLAEPKLGAPRRLGAVARLRPHGLRRGSLLTSLCSERRLVGVGRLALPRLFGFEPKRSDIPVEPHAGVPRRSSENER
jgi:hypothetical protein